MHNFFVIDLETAGMDEAVNPIMELAIVVIDGIKLEVLEEYSTYVQPYLDEPEYNQKAIDTHGITRKVVEEQGIPIAQVVKDMLALQKKYKGRGKGNKDFPMFVAHNASFERRFLQMLFAQCDKYLYDFFHVHMEDTMMMWRVKYPHKMASLNAAARDVGLELDDAHRALNDTRTTALLYKWLIGQLRNDTTMQIVQQGSTNARGSFRFQIQRD